MTDRFHLKILSLLLLAVIVEGVFVLQVLRLGYTPLTHYDYQVYNQLALNILDQGVFSMDETSPFRPTTFRPPGYPAFIALVYLLGNKTTLAVGIAQFLLLALTAYLLYGLALRFTGRLEAIVSSLLCVSYPALVFLTPLYIAEIATTFFVTAAVLAVVHLQRERGRLWHYFGLGLAMGMAALMRPSFLMLAFVVAATLLLCKGRNAIRRQLLPVAVIFLGYCLLIAPWIVRNRLLVGEWINVHTGAGWTLYVSAQQYAGEISNRLLKPEWTVVVDEFNRRTREAQTAIPGPSEANGSLLARQEVWRDQVYMRDAKVRLKLIPPSQYLREIPGRLFMLWSTADSSPWQTGLLHRFQQLLHVTLFGLILIGCFIARSDLSKQWPLWSLPVYLTLLHLVFHVEARYTVPARQFLLVYAGMGLVGLLRQVRLRSALVDQLFRRKVVEPGGTQRGVE